MSISGTRKWVILLAFVIVGVRGKPLPPPRPALLVISLDAFRPEYLQRNVTPFLNAFGHEGVRAKFMRSSFPTKTFPNHHTIATGLYPAVHGVTGNSVFDPQKGLLEYGTELFHYRDDIIPIYTLNEMAGNGRHSGCMMWTGSAFSYSGKSCTFTEVYNRNLTWPDRVDKIIDWFKHPTTPANLVMMYFDEPDFSGHIYGPDSDVTTKILTEIDTIASTIDRKLKQNNLYQRVNVIFVSDHGMDSVSPPNFIDLTKIVPPNLATIYGTSPVLQVVPTKQQEETVFNALSEAAQKSGHFRVYKASTAPSHWHFDNPRRCGPITVVAEPNYAFQDMWQAIQYYEKAHNRSIQPTNKYGIHGYDNAHASMYSIFMARGPQMQYQKVVESLDNVDLYLLFCKILDLKAPPTNGTLANVLPILESATLGAGSGARVLPLALGAIFITIGSMTIIFYTIRRNYRTRQTMISLPQIEDDRNDEERASLLEFELDESITFKI